MGSCLSSPKSSDDSDTTVRLRVVGNGEKSNYSNNNINNGTRVGTTGSISRTGNTGDGPPARSQTSTSARSENGYYGHSGLITPAASGAPMLVNSSHPDNNGSNNSSGSNPIKILLLGSGESGKSTILKQMKIIHQNGYSQEERLMYKTTVYKNLLDCAKAVVDALSKFSISVDSESESLEGEHQLTTDDTSAITKVEAITKAVGEGDGTNEQKSIIVPVTKEDLDYISESIISPDPDSILDPKLAAIVENLWARPEVRTLVSQRRAEFYIMDSAPYFFSNVSRIAHPEYIPTVNDILRARIKTTGIYETRFDMGGLNILMYDVGGQRSERKKWIHCFENVTLVIFCVALSEYDQVLLEEKGQNRLAESLVLFDSIINSPWFSRTSVVLFLNKIDVFTEKLPYSPLENYFTDYTGGNDVNKAVKYILWRFTQTNRSGLNIYPHLTQATDTSNIRLVFAAVKETILQNALKDSGIL